MRTEEGESFGTREGEKKIYKIARAGQMKRQDLGKIGMIKDRNGRILQDEEQIKNRWKEYFNTLLNVENERGELEKVAKTERPINQISREEIKKAMGKMKSGKAAGPSEVVIELIKAMGANGENWTLELAKRIIEEMKIPDDWKKCELVTIYENKGDILECEKHQGIKLTEHLMKVIE